MDSVKNWIFLASRGEQELERSVDKLFEMRDYLVGLIRQKKNFKLVLDEPQGNTVSFWYLPDSLLQLGWANVQPDLLHQVCPKLKGMMMDEGTMMVNYQPITAKKLPNFFRMVLTCQPEVQKSTMDFVISEIERIGSRLTFG